MALHPYTRLNVKTAAPTVNDDETATPRAYEIGDIWINTTTGIIYRCIDDSDGAAVWLDLAKEIDQSPDKGAAVNSIDRVPLLDSDNGDALAYTELGNIYVLFRDTFEIDSTFITIIEEIIEPFGDDLYIQLEGWEPHASLETWTFAIADDPVYQIYVSGNVTANPSYKLGNKVRCTNNSTTFYGFIVKVGAYDSGNDRTPVDLYGGTDYDLANSAITAPYISKIKSPDGFPLNPDKWTVSLTDTSNRSQASPVSGTWYNLGSLSLAIPIGVWRVYYELALEISITTAAVAAFGFRSTLSTANNSESDSGFSTNYVRISPIATALPFRETAHREKIVALTSKTTHYLNALSPAVNSVSFRGDLIATVVRAVCAYL